MVYEEFLPFNKEPKWFKDFKENRKNFLKVENMIESAKFKFDRDFNVPKWLLGTGIAFLFSPFLNLIRQNNFIYLIANFLFVTAIIEFFIGILIIIELNNRQKICMAYLFREKDKEEKIILKQK
jgi:hypothetical protein